MAKQGWFVSAIAAAAMTTVVSIDVSAQIVHRRGTTPDYHVVNDGDTMWDLSGSYYSDTYNWPRLWGYNAHVTNPHWIYPGDILYLRPPTVGGEEMPAAMVEQPTEAGEMMLPVAGFITTKQIEYVGRIAASPKEAVMLSPLDTVWLDFGEDARDEGDEDTKLRDIQAKDGDVFAVVRQMGTLDNEDGEAVGQKYVVVGSVRVTKTSEKYHDEAVVEQSWVEMYRGDYLIPYERQLKAVQPVRSEKDGVAKIVDSMWGTQYFGEHHYVFINKGAEEGVRVGNRFFILQRFEGMDPIGTEPGEKIPWQTVGQVVVVDVRGQYSLAVVTDSKREIEIGDRLERYQGY